MLFPTSGQVDVWRRPKEAYNPEFLVLVVKAGGGSLMIWTATYWYSADAIITLNGQITASDYVDILGNQVHSVVQMMFPNNDAVFQDDISPVHSPKSWFEEHEEMCHFHNCFHYFVHLLYIRYQKVYPWAHLFQA